MGNNSAVEHPDHYTSHPSGIEAIEIIEHYNFNIGSAMKYLWRNGLKNVTNQSKIDEQIQDLYKAIWYIRRECEKLKKEKK